MVLELPCRIYERTSR